MARCLLVVCADDGNGIPQTGVAELGMILDVGTECPRPKSPLRSAIPSQKLLTVGLSKQQLQQITSSSHFGTDIWFFALVRGEKPNICWGFRSPSAT
jgi:hypothetical protein